MKHCPQCNRVESDETLKFCRVDGTALISDSGSIGGDTGTAMFGSAPVSSEVETSILPHISTAPEINRATSPTTVLPSTQTPSTTRELSKPKRRGILFASTGFAVLVIAVAGYFYFSRKNNATIQSIAVMPFLNQNSDPSTEYLSDGIPESIINSLSQLPNLKVMSRNSVFHYKGKDMDAQAVAKELKVQAVLTGRVAQRGEDLAINVELINAQDNSQIWGQQYNRKLADVFAVQEEIAKEISEKLRLKLTSAQQAQLAKRPTDNLKAFQYYVQGRSYALRRTREDLNTAIQYNQNALAEDPNYALAYAGLADAYVSLGVLGYIAPIEGRREAEEAARKALSLDETLPEAHVAAGQAAVTFAPSDFLLGDRELQQAIRLSPSLSLAHFYVGISFARQGRIDESLKAFQTAHDLDPLSSVFARSVALPYYLKRDYIRALQVLRDANHLGPPFSTTFEAGIYLETRAFDETLAELIKARKERPNDPIVINAIGILYAGQGKRPEANLTIKELEAVSGNNVDQALWIAKIYSVLEQKEPALSWLARGADTGAIGTFYKDDPIWDSIRADPRFGELLKRLGLPQ